MVDPCIVGVFAFFEANNSTRFLFRVFPSFQIKQALVVGALEDAAVFDGLFVGVETIVDHYRFYLL